MARGDQPAHEALPAQRCQGTQGLPVPRERTGPPGPAGAARPQQVPAGPRVAASRGSPHPAARDPIRAWAAITPDRGRSSARYADGRRGRTARCSTRFSATRLGACIVNGQHPPASSRPTPAPRASPSADPAVYRGGRRRHVQDALSEHARPFPLIRRRRHAPTRSDVTEGTCPLRHRRTGLQRPRSPSGG